MDEQKVMAFVREALEKDPDQPSATIFDQAKQIDRGVRKLTLRQFHARFPLQVKRRKALESGNGRAKRRRARVGREKAAAAQREAQAGVRETFLQFAAALTAAGDRAELVRVLAGVDEYVDRAMGAVQGKEPPGS